MVGNDITTKAPSTTIPSVAAFKVMTYMIGLLPFILCLSHLVATPFFFRITSYFRFLAFYIGFTIGTLGLTLWISMNFLPKEMGWGGLVYVYPLAIPLAVAAIALFIATFMYLQRLAAARQGSQWMKYDQPTNRNEHLTTKPKDLTRELIREIISIVAFSAITLLLCPVIWFIFMVLMPDFTSAIQNNLLPGIDTNLLRTLGSLVVTEIVWQFWVRKITRSGSVLSRRPIGYHLLILALGVCLASVPEILSFFLS